MNEWSGPGRYGRFPWVVELTTGESISLYADRVDFHNGGIALIGKADSPVFAVAAGDWRYVYAASTLHGRPLVAERWGERFASADRGEEPASEDAVAEARRGSDDSTAGTSARSRPRGRTSAAGRSNHP